MLWLCEHIYEWLQIIQIIFMPARHIGVNDYSWETIISVSPIYYRPTTKLREGNVFTGVCLLFCSGGCHVTITHDALHLTVQSHPVPEPAPLPPLVIWDMTTPPPPDMGPPTNQSWHLVATEARTVRNRAVRILLECFLVYVCKHFILIWSDMHGAHIYAVIFVTTPNWNMDRDQDLYKTFYYPSTFQTRNICKSTKRCILCLYKSPF